MITIKTWLEKLHITDKNRPRCYEIRSIDIAIAVTKNPTPLMKQNAHSA